MKVILLVVGTCWNTITAYAQDKHSYWSAGVDLSAPVYTAVGDMKGVLTGLFVKQEWRWSKRFAGTVSAGYQYFHGSIRAFDGKETEGFAVIPLLAGLRYYVRNKYYAGLEVGAGIKAHKNAATRLTLAPAAGTVLPFARRHIDLGIWFYTVPMGYSHPEQKLLVRGGYSFLGARLAFIW